MKHCFNVDVAKEVGINAAVIFENLSFWIHHNAKTGRNKHKGTHWMYATQKEIAEQFDYLTVKQARVAIEKLVGAGYIKTDCFNRHKYDRTQWYALTEKGSTVGQIEVVEVPKKTQASGKKGATIPDVKADIKPFVIPSKERIDEIRRMCGIV